MFKAKKLAYEFLPTTNEAILRLDRYISKL
jgi:hypothetical protein